MLIGSRQRIRTFNSSPSLTINDVPVKQVSHTKSLGVHIDDNLTWNVHIEKLCKNVASGIGPLKHIRSFVPPYTMQLIYNCLVQPYFDYCCVVWDSCGNTLANKLQKLQNRAAGVLILHLIMIQMLNIYLKNWAGKTLNLSEKLPNL